MAFAEEVESSSASSRVDAVASAHAIAIVRRVRHADFVHLSAPTGFGKTELATQVARDDRRPLAWCSIRPDTSEAALWADVGRSLLAAWPDAPNVPADVTEANAQSLVDRCLEVVGETTLVLDDIDHLPTAALDSVVERLAAARSVRVVTTSQHGPSPAMALLEAAGRLARVDRRELAFSADECATMTADPTAGRELHDATAGWPVAVLIGARAAGGAADGDPDDALFQLLVRSRPEIDRSRVAVAALLERFPRCIVEWIMAPVTRQHAPGLDPLLLQPAGGDYAIRRWARDAVSHEPLPSETVDHALALLRDAGDEEARLTLAVRTGRIDQVLTDVERFCAQQLVSGGHPIVRRLVDHIPPERRSLDLRVASVLAEQASSRRRPTASELRELVADSRDESGTPSPRASSALANHLRMVGDAGVLDVCLEVVGPLVDLEPDEAATAARSTWPSLHDRLAAGELLRFLGQGTMLSAGEGSFATGRRMIESAIRIADDEHLALAHRGWVMYIEALLLVTAPRKVVLRARTIAFELWRSRHSDAPLRLSELAILEFFAGFHDRSRATIETAREAAAEIGNDLATIPLAGLECALDVIDSPESADLVDAFERTIVRLLDHDFLAIFHQVFAAEFGILQLRLGHADVASRFLAIAEASPDSFMSASFSLRRRRLDALLRLHDDRAAGREALTELRALAARLDRAALVDLVDADVSEAVPPPPSDVADIEPIRITALGPAFAVHLGDAELPAPSGFTAKLLALLVASGGVVTVDVALETLWPDTDPAVSRNRLHGVLLRLRRALGLGPDGPVTCRDELIRLQSGAELSCDAWDVEAALRAGEAVGRVPALLSEQFRYDDRVDAYRQHLRRLADASTG